MQISLAILASAVLLLAWRGVPRLSMLVMSFTVVVVGYVFGYELWHANAGPLPLTLDRVLLLVVAGAFGWRVWRGQVGKTNWTGLDWALGLTLGWLTTSCLFSLPGDDTTLPSSPIFRLAVSFWIPAFLYAALRCEPIDGRAARWLMTGVASLGVYLAVTAVLETAGVWSLVFPRYIANPETGLHFGRARGPALNSVSLGVYLGVAATAAWLLIPRSWRAMQVFWLGAVGLMSLGVLLTYTRSTWLGLAAAVYVVVGLQLPRRWRTRAMVGTAVVGVALAAVGKDAIVGLKREDSAGVSAHSVQQRTAFAYVSAAMFKDHPVAGVGFGRFYDQKLPYLTDRRQSFELESLRDLHHHNTFLSLLTETGLLGLAAYVAVLAGFATAGWRLAHSAEVDPDCRRLGLLMLGTLAVYVPSALFHDLTLVHSDQWLLFLVGGTTVACLVNRAAVAPAPALAPVQVEEHAPAAPVIQPKLSRRVRMFGMTIDRLTLDRAALRLLEWSKRPQQLCRYVVTPNVDHAVMYQEHAGLRRAYADAALVVADGAPLIAASRLLGRPLPERVAGSDLAPQLMAFASKMHDIDPTMPPLRVFLLGAGPGVAERAAENIRRRWPGVEPVGTHCPPLGFEGSELENEKALAAIAAAEPDLLLVGLGAPKQELWVHRHHRRIAARVALCAGATIDFLAGEKRRSPVWLQRLGLEWLHRLLSEPRRLASRYARDAWIFPRLVAHELWAKLARPRGGPVAG